MGECGQGDDSQENAIQVGASGYSISTQTPPTPPEIGAAAGVKCMWGAAILCFMSLTQSAACNTEQQIYASIPLNISGMHYVSGLHYRGIPGQMRQYPSSCLLEFNA